MHTQQTYHRAVRGARERAIPQYLLYTITACGLLLVLICSPAAGQTTRPTLAASPAWTFDVAPYLWVPGIYGDVAVRGRTADVSLSPADFLSTLFDSFKFAALGRVEARRGPLVFILDLLYLSLEEENTTRLGIETNVEFSQLMLEFGGGYRLGEWPLGTQPWPRLAVEVLGGGRYVHLDSELRLAGTGPLGARVDAEGTVDWLEPFFGARFKLAFSEALSLVVRGDVGGFGVGSEVTWSLIGTLQYRVSRCVTLAGGYRVIDIDYEQGSGAERFVFDVQMRGPIFGLVIHF